MKPKIWIPDSPDDAMRLAYEGVFTDVPRLAVDRCLVAMVELPLVQRQAQRDEALEHLKRLKDIVGTDKATSRDHFIFARSLIVCQVCRAIELAEADVRQGPDRQGG